MITIPPMHFLKIKNPVILDEKGEPLRDKDGQIKLSHSEIEYRFQTQYKNPFFLYSGEKQVNEVQKLSFIKQDQSLRLKAVKKFTDNHFNHYNKEEQILREVGDEWLFYGPSIYYPRPEVESFEIRNPILIEPESALRLHALQNYIDRNGVKRKAGEEWLVRTHGSYILEVYEKRIDICDKKIITNTEALHITAIKSFTDCYGKEHKAGEEWLITPDISTWHILDVYEKLVDVVNKLVLTKDQYVVIVDPVDQQSGKNLKGSKKLVKGQKSFFLQPGEKLENGIENVYILNETQALLLQAKEKFTDETGNVRTPGDKWMIRGPCRFIPSIEVKIIEQRSIIPLDNKEGIYVRDTKTGNVRAVIGKSYLLEANEELWEKEISKVEEEILRKSSPDKESRKDKTRVVTFSCPYNTALQIYNFKTDKNRIVFGPEYVMLEPDEQFNIMYLSGKTPKVPGVVKTLYLNMGPTYTTDQIEVETSDHALLIIEVSYNWSFDISKNDDFEKQRKLFSVRDCIGEMCSIMASRVRGAVAEMTVI
jgi:major vault protein